MESFNLSDRFRDLNQSKPEDAANLAVNSALLMNAEATKPIQEEVKRLEKKIKKIKGIKEFLEQGLELVDRAKSRGCKSGDQLGRVKVWLKGAP